MSLSHLSVAQLKQAVALLKERESLQSQLEKVDQQLREIENEKSSVRIKHQPNNRHISDGDSAKRPRRRRNTQQAVLNALKSAGSKGVTVKELAFRSKVKASSLSTWLYTNGKTVAGIKKLKPGIFTYISD